MKIILSIFLCSCLLLLNACQHYNKDDESYGFTVATRDIDITIPFSTTPNIKTITLNGSILGFGPVKPDSVGFIITRTIATASSINIKGYSPGKAHGNYSLIINGVDTKNENEITVQAFGKVSGQKAVLGKSLTFTIK